jgi:ParB/RepB/Spo0J family partition protein
MSNGEQKEVNIGLVVRPVPPVREHFDEQELASLTKSIRENGVLVPLMVRQLGDKFEVVDGDRRLAAAWAAGLRKIPVMVHPLSDSETHLQRLLANLDRHDPDPVSEAKYIAKIIHKKTFTIPEFAKKLGRTINWIEGRLTIAEMPEYMRQALSTQEISLGVCMELHNITDAKTKERYFRDALRNGMTVHTAKVNSLMVNEAIEAVAETGEEITEQTIPTNVRVPRSRCAYTGEEMPITQMRMVRVGIDNYEKWTANLNASPSSTPL